MFDVDFGPGVFMGIIAFVLTAPALYGIILVDAFYKKHQQEKATDVFN